MKDLYSEPYKILMKQIEDDINKSKDSVCSWKNEYGCSVHIIKKIYRFNEIPVKILMAFFTELEQINLQIFMQPQKILNSQSSLKKEESWSYYAP